MTSVSCRYCGLPFKVVRVKPDQDHFCCTGCAMASRIPVNAEGHFPVNAHLVSALVVGFLYFNQLLAWLLSSLLRNEGRLELAVRFGWNGAASALVVLLGVMIVQTRERSLRALDWCANGLALAVQIWAFRELPPSAWCLAVANAGLIVWSLRGLLRKKVRGK